MGVSLAPGWFGDPVVWSKKQFPADMHNLPCRPHALPAQLEVRYADGSSETIASDEFWKAQPSPLTPVRSQWWYCFGCSGETFDGTRDTPGWDQPGFGDRQWTRINYTRMSTVTAKC